MRSYEASSFIDVTPERVWPVLMDAAGSRHAGSGLIPNE
jgi:hypothetical protein